MNEKQAQVYDFIIEYKRFHDGNSPSLEEIAVAVECTKAWAAKLLDLLQQAGILKYHGTRQIDTGGTWMQKEVAL